MKHIVGKANRRIANKKFRMMKCGIAALSLFLNNNGRIPYFDIRYSLFDIRYSIFQSFFLIQLAVILAGGGAEP